MSKCFSILGSESAAIHCDLCNELRICLLVQKPLGERGRPINHLYTPTGYGLRLWLKNVQGQWALKHKDIKRADNDLAPSQMWNL